MNFKEILTNIARAIVDNPDAVVVEETVDGDDIHCQLAVSKDCVQSLEKIEELFGKYYSLKNETIKCLDVLNYSSKETKKR